ncbi:MAG TPA: HAD hydrolase family protein [Pyrinomonadaceae bacterium]|jgi:3-deoxy-D-manno-octulosonate 8-phosphate phosphatase (KDO 8-P phosphatase)|nr:HAD hydrolase family protein [Pyrinomonadaceae bacterium]
MKNITEDILARAKKIKLVLMDCDGVLTDGKIYFNEHGEETKAFNTKDGLGIVLLHRAGIATGIITGRVFNGLKRRAEELGIRYLRMGCDDKTEEFENILADAGVSAEETAYIGDDLPDIALLKKAGLAVAVADSVREVLEAAHYITEKNGGDGAVREVADLILQARK